MSIHITFWNTKNSEWKKKFTRMKEKLKNKYPKTQMVITLGTINIINL